MRKMRFTVDIEHGGQGEHAIVITLSRHRETREVGSSTIDRAIALASDVISREWKEETE